MQTGGALRAVYDDIEKELFQLGLTDPPTFPSLPRRFGGHSATAIAQTQPPPPLPPDDDEDFTCRPSASSSFTPHDGGYYGRLYRHRSYDDRFLDHDFDRTVRSSSAPAMPFGRQLSNPDDLYLLSTGGVGRIRGSASSGTRSLSDMEPPRPRSSSHGAVVTSGRNHFRPMVSSAPMASWKNSGGVHYPGYVELQDFLTLPRGPYEEAPNDFFLSAEEEAEAEMMERQLIASVEAVLRKVHAGIQESHIHYDFPDSIAEPPPPQPIGATLRDPPPSPEPPHNNVSPPMPSINGQTRLPTNRHGLLQRTTSGPSRVDREDFFGPHGHSRLCSRSSLDNGTTVDQTTAFLPSLHCGGPDPKSHPTTSSHGSSSSKHHHRHHRHRCFEETPHHFHHHHHQRRTSKALRKIKNIAAIARGSGIKIVKIFKDLPSGAGGFGFSIKGSLEKGLGVYVSRVEESGPAWVAGLRQGDLLLAANNQPVSQMSHTEIISLLKCSEEISLTVAGTSPLSAPVVVSQSYSWVTSDLRPTSPPAEYNPRKHHHQVCTICVEVVGSDGLGLMVRGGAEYGLGISITGVDTGSAAFKGGLKVGDQILEVNGESFLAVTHDTAVRILKYSRHLKMSVRRIGKVPHSCTTFHRKRSTKRKSRLGDPLCENLQATLVMIEEKSKSVLSPTDHSRLHDVVTDYATGRVPVARLLEIAARVLDSPNKLSLLTELREVVKTCDLGEFDATVFSQSSNLFVPKGGNNREFKNKLHNNPPGISSSSSITTSLSQMSHSL